LSIASVIPGPEFELLGNRGVLEPHNLRDSLAVGNSNPVQTVPLRNWGREDSLDT